MVAGSVLIMLTAKLFAADDVSFCFCAKQFVISYAPPEEKPKSVPNAAWLVPSSRTCFIIFNNTRPSTTTSVPRLRGSAALETAEYIHSDRFVLQLQVRRVPFL